jgi:diaminopimelate epimerase
MQFSFNKMQGLGNDFVVVDALDAPIALSNVQIAHIADRRRGVGCDQLLMIEPAKNGNADFLFRIFNADGSPAEQCGNGARCVARYLHDERGFKGKDIVAEIVNDTIRMRFEEDGCIAVEMGRPRFEPADIPLKVPQRATQYDAEIAGESVAFSALSMGNPHAVLLVEGAIADAPVERQGPAVQQSGLFPAGVNVGFMAVRGRDKIDLRVYERGVGETRACGSGACAAVVAGRNLGLLDESVEVHLPGGVLNIQWSGEEGTVWMKGPATHVFQGTMTI